MSEINVALPSKPTVPSWQILGRAVATVFDTLLGWQQRANERAHLRTLDDRMLSDMGIGRAEAEREAALPFWRGF